MQITLVSSELSNVGPEGRSFEPITKADLARLADIARGDLCSFFERYPDWAAQYEDRVLAIALCQGAAKHYVGGACGINDFDVYTFFARHPERAWYAKRRKQVDFGDPKFGMSADRPDFVGRRVDLLGRSIDAPVGTDAAAAIGNWLRSGRPGESSTYLAEKTVVLLWPTQRLGEVVWPQVASLAVA